MKKIELNEALGLLHHGKCSGIFIPRETDTDYIYFWCRKCMARADIVGVLIDNSGRIIFNLKCPKCGELDALKTVVKSLNQVHLSPKLAPRIKRHEWDNA